MTVVPIAQAWTKKAATCSLSHSAQLYLVQDTRNSIYSQCTKGLGKVLDSITHELATDT